MLKFPQNRRFNQLILGSLGRNGSTLTKGTRAHKGAVGKIGKCAQEKVRPPPPKGSGGLVRVSLLGLDCAGGAGALASAAVDAGAGVDDGLAFQSDRAHGAGALTSAARNTSVSNLTSHVTYTSNN